MLCQASVTQSGSLILLNVWVCTWGSGIVAASSNPREFLKPKNVQVNSYRPNNGLHMQENFRVRVTVHALAFASVARETDACASRWAADKNATLLPRKDTNDSAFHTVVCSAACLGAKGMNKMLLVRKRKSDQRSVMQRTISLRAACQLRSSEWRGYYYRSPSTPGQDGATWREPRLADKPAIVDPA